MGFKEFLQLVGALIVSIGGSGAVIFGLSSWLGKVWANRILENDRAKYQKELEGIKSNYQKELEQYKAHLEKSKSLFLRYSEHQFTLYNDLWGQLCVLKSIADDLWELATKENLQCFVDSLKITKDKVEKSRLLLEDKHYDNLNRLLDNFNNYKVRKENLGNLRNKKSELWQIVIDQMLISKIINENRNLKEEYSTLINELAFIFKTQITQGNS